MAHPPQTIISLPVHTAVCWARAAGGLVVLVAVHVSPVHGGVGVGVALGPTAQYLLPPFKKPPLLTPPQTIIWLPVHTAVCQYRPLGALLTLVAVQPSMLGSYRPPVLKYIPAPARPPQMIIS